MSAVDLRALIGEAMRHHGAGDLARADALYRRVLEVEPEEPDARHLHGVVAHQRGRHQIAVEQIRRALAARPGHPGYLNNLGEAYRAQRQFREAMDCYRQVLAANPRDTNAINNLGLALHHLHRFREAEQRFDEALAITPGDPEIHMNRGNLLRDEGDLGRALDAYRKAIDRAPGFAPAHAWLGVTLYELGRGEEAVASLTRATELAPLDIEAHNNLKRVRWNLDQREHLHDSFRRACERLPQAPEAWLNLAESLTLNGLHGEAAEAVERALALDPGCARGWSLLGTVRAGQGLAAQAVEAHQRALALDPEDPHLRESCAYALLDARRYEDAREVLAQGHRIAPRLSSALAHLTIAMNETGDPQVHGLVDYQRFVHPRLIEVPEGFHDLEHFNAALHEELARQHLTPNHALEQTMRGGTQTLNNLFQNPTGLVAVLERQIRKVVDAYVASLPEDPSHAFLRYRNPDYVFTGAWSTILRENGYDGAHVHNEGWLSGTYYVRTPALNPAQLAAGEGCIQFGEPPQRFASERNATRRSVAPQVGLVVLFPSYYWHGVRGFASGGVRHSVSYDVV